MNKIPFLCVVLSLFFIAACVPPSVTSKQREALIVDAETAAPIPGAVIDLHFFPNAPESPDPDRPQASANAQGEITIGSKSEAAIWQVQADGFIEQQLSSKEGALPRYAAHATEDYDGVVHLYQLPEPQLTVVVSDTFTGPLTINLLPAPGFDYVLADEINVTFAAVDSQTSYVQDVVGTRIFTETASTDGVVDLVVTPLLYDIQSRQLEIRDSSSVLPYREIANPQDKERGIWGSINEDDKRLHRQIRLFVGTLEEHQAYLESVR